MPNIDIDFPVTGSCTFEIVDQPEQRGGPPGGGDFYLMESGDFYLQENGDFFLLE